jgi:hypothetical protein
VRRILPVVLLCGVLGAPGLSGQATRTPGTIQFPTAMTPWSTKMAVGMSVIAMPAAIVQEAASIRWPLFHFDMVMGLPQHFTLAGAVSTEFLTNHFEVAPRWTANLTDRLHADAGVGLAYWFGRLNQETFQNKVHGWFVYPTASIGYDFGTMALTAQAKASFITSLYIQSGELESNSTSNMFNGFSYRISLEQPFVKHTTIGLSVQMNRLKFYYPQWPLFPTFDRYFWIPEAQLRVTL